MAVQVCVSWNWHLDPKIPQVEWLPECFPVTQGECQTAGEMLALIHFPVPAAVSTGVSPVH